MTEGRIPDLNHLYWAFLRSSMEANWSNLFIWNHQKTRARILQQLLVQEQPRVNEILPLLEAKVIFSSSHLHGNLSGQSNPPENLLKIQVEDLARNLPSNWCDFTSFSHNLQLDQAYLGDLLTNHG